MTKVSYETGNDTNIVDRAVEAAYADKAAIAKTAAYADKVANAKAAVDAAKAAVYTAKAVAYAAKAAAYANKAANAKAVAYDAKAVADYMASYTKAALKNDSSKQKERYYGKTKS